MTLPSLPGLGTTSWFDWASAVHAAADEVTTGRLTDDALRAAIAALAPKPAIFFGLPFTRRNNVNQINATTTTTVGTSRLLYKVRRPASNVRAVFAHFNNQSTDAPPSGAITFSAALEVGGVVIPLTFQGRRVPTHDGGLLVSDPIAVDIAVGTSIWVRTYLASGTAYVTHQAIPVPGEGFAAASDLTGAGAGAVGSSLTMVYGAAMLVTSDQPGTAAIWGITGDSIAAGFGDSPPAPDYGYGYLRAADAAGVSVVTIARSGERVADAVAAGGSSYRGPLVADCTHILASYGRNDVSNSTPVATIQADLLTYWTRLSARGAKVFHTTITPYTTSTDGWATPGNQTLASGANEPNRVTLNTWLRAGAPINSTTLAAVAVGTSGALVMGDSGHPLEGIFDVADAVETARDSGKWLDLTDDGLHPNGAGHTAIVAIMDLASVA